MSRDKKSHLRLAGRPADYQRLGIDPLEVAQFEDGQRIGTEKGRYEWWYFDAHLDDGATVVVVFYTKPNVTPNGPLAPRITIDLTLPDGRRFEKFYDTTAHQFTASKEGCDVRIGTNRFIGDLRRYLITATVEEISVEIELTGEVRAWRPKTGHIYFGAEGRETLFAWLPSVPQGVAHVRYTIGHEEYRASGSGYHDHNWGDVPMQTLMHNWYWARAKAGPYTIIASHITATEAYGYEKAIFTERATFIKRLIAKIVGYMLARGDEIVADDDVRVSFEIERVATDGKTGKPVADITRYTYRDGDARYVVTFERQKTILQAIFTERATFIKRLIAKIVGFDGAYHRFTGRVTVEKFEKDVRVEIFDDHAIWELMYFGKARLREMTI
jgi:hypothetical protein